MDVFERAPPDHEDGPGCHLGAILADGLVHRVGLAPRQRHELRPSTGSPSIVASPPAMSRKVGSRSTSEQAFGPRPCATPGPAMIKRHARGVLKEVHLVPQAALAQHVAVIGGHDDDGVVHLANVFQRCDDLADLAVEIADIGR
jgi:hypothetical protein